MHELQIRVMQKNDVFVSIENLGGSSGADRFVGNELANVLTGFAGNDTLEGGGGADTLNGNTGTDTSGGIGSMDMASYSLSNSAVRANLDDSTKNTGDDAVGDVYRSILGLIGSDYDDTLVGNSNANRLEGRVGNDTLIGGAGADTLVGGEGSDWASYSTALAAVTANLDAPGNNQGDALGDSYNGIENLLGSDYADTLQGNSGKNIINGGKGDDTLFSNGGGDSLIGGDDKDTVSYQSASVAVDAYLDNSFQSFNSGAAVGDTFVTIENIIGSAFDDLIAGDGNVNALDGGGGNDTLIGGDGADALTGGAGTDTASYATAPSAVTLDLNTGGTLGEATGDSFVTIENVIGSIHADALSGNSSDNQMDGGKGDDSISGGGGNDSLFGGDGDDSLKNSGVGRHLFDGGLGSNTVSYDGFTTAVDLNLARTDGNTNGAGGQEFFINIQNLTGGTLADSLSGDGQNNILRGGSGNDSLFGAAGNDLLLGEVGDDVLAGGSGADTLNGGDGTFDSASYANASARVVLDLGTPSNGLGDAQGDVLIDIESIVGSGLNDTFIAGGSKTNYTYDGGSGSDTVSFIGASGAVTVSLSDGISTGSAAQGAIYLNIENLIGSVHADSLKGSSAANKIEGGDGDDTLTGGLGGNDTLDGGLGSNTANYSSFVAINSLTFNLGTLNNGFSNVTIAGGSQVDKLANIDTVLGSGGGDNMTGNENNNLFEGRAGNDSLNGAGGADTLDGGDGNDLLDGGAGPDLLEGGNAIDTVTYVSSTAAGGLTISLLNPGVNTDNATGDTYSNIENLRGSIFNDNLTGDTNPNQIEGLDGNDLIEGGSGNDTLNGGSGDDTLVGGVGSDSLIGGQGTSDVVTYAAITTNLTIDLTNTTLGAGNSSSGIAFGDVIDSTVEILLGASGTGVATTFLSGTRTTQIMLQGQAGAANLVEYTHANNSVTASLADAATNSGAARFDRYTNIQHLTGSSQDDNLTGIVVTIFCMAQMVMMCLTQRKGPTPSGAVMQQTIQVRAMHCALT